jgi:hypothetical protein
MFACRGMLRSLGVLAFGIAVLAVARPASGQG